jgi:hypothetical protein
MSTNRTKRQALAILSSLLGAALLSNSHAATLSYSNGDLMLGFYSPNASQSYLVDLGAASIYRDATGTMTLSLGNIGTDLTAVFGNTWNTDPDVHWGIFGTDYKASIGNASNYLNGDASNTLYVSAPESPIGSAATAPYSASPNNAQATPASKIFAMGQNASTNANYSTTANSSKAVIEPNTDAKAFGSSTIQTNNGGTSFGSFNGALGTFQNGTSGTALDLFRIVNTSDPSTGTTIEGTFTISNSGVVTFTAVPEPSTLASIALGGAVLFLAARNRRSRHCNS